MFIYAEKFGQVLKPYRHTIQNYLEIGLDTGLSLKHWQDYFNCNVYGIDITLSNLKIDSSLYNIYEFSSIDEDKYNYFLKNISFDLILDDGAPHLHIETFNIASKFLSENGIYIIETFRSTQPYANVSTHLSKKHPSFIFTPIYSFLSKKMCILAKKR